jgi:phospholipid transport system substrate-binding protein
MRFILTLTCLAVLSLAPGLGLLAPASAQTPMAPLSEAEQMAQAIVFVDEMADEAITILTTATTRQGRENGFRDLLERRADMRRIARFTLGQFVRKISDEDFITYQALLNDMIVKVYANRLGEYSNEKVVVGSGQRKKRNFIINSKIEFANGRAAIPIDWWLVQEKDASFSLFDVRVLGVWMAQEQRDSFSSVLKNNKGDIETLLQHIRNQVIDVDPAEDVGTNG